MCIANKGNFVTIPKNSPSLALRVLKLLKLKGFVQVFQKEPISGNFVFKLFLLFALSNKFRSLLATERNVLQKEDKERKLGGRWTKLLP